MKTCAHLTQVRFFSILVAVSLALVFLAACSTGGQPVTGAERDRVLAYSEAKTDNLLAGLNANDYATFSRDFDDKMRDALTQSAFGQTQIQVVGKIGKYVSRQVNLVEKTGDFIAVVYDAKFEQEEGVTVRVVFEGGGAHDISGLWFNSPKLRQQ